MDMMSGCGTLLVCLGKKVWDCTIVFTQLLKNYNRHSKPLCISYKSILFSEYL